MKLAIANFTPEIQPNDLGVKLAFADFTPTRTSDSLRTKSNVNGKDYASAELFLSDIIMTYKPRGSLGREFAAEAAKLEPY